MSLLLSLFVSTGCFSLVLADCGDNVSTYSYQDKTGTACPPTFDQFGGIITAILEAIISIAGVIFFFMIVVNGFNFITAMGDTEKLNNARKGLVFTIIGFGLLFGSFVILSIIANVAGIKSGFSISPNGQVQFNILSTFTPTPLPTVTDTPDTGGGGSSSGP